MLVRLEMYLDNEVGDQRLSERFALEVSAAKSFSNIRRSLYLEVLLPTKELSVILSGLSFVHAVMPYNAAPTLPPGCTVTCLAQPACPGLVPVIETCLHHN